MLKLISRRRSTSGPSFFPISGVDSPPFSRFINSYPQDEDDIHNPPFSSPPKTLVKPQSTPDEKNKQRISTKPKGSSNNVNSEGDLPVKSDLPFDFRYSYSETNPDVKPIGFREPRRLSPFGPGRLDRKWTGTSAPAEKNVDHDKYYQQRKDVLGEPLTEEEIAELVEKYCHDDCSRQINLGKGGLTHNMLESIHNYWKKTEAVRIECLGVPTLDMDNICFHLEDKSGGVIIYRHINVLLLYRGRNYDPKNRPVIPLMLRKPHAPIYPKLVKPIADGLTFEETQEMRNKGLKADPLMKLVKNGVYVNVVERVKSAFETEEVVRLDCSGVNASDCKRIGVKLRDLVPCVPILFKDEQIILWRGKDCQKIAGLHQNTLPSFGVPGYFDTVHMAKNLLPAVVPA